MSVLKIKDEFGNWVSVPAIKGEPGAPGATAAHAAKHAKGGKDEITPSSIGAAEADHTHSCSELGAATADHTHTPASIGAVSKGGDTVNGNLNVNGALAVERSDNNRKARTVVHQTGEVDMQNYVDDSNYVGIRVKTESTGAGDAAEVVHVQNGVGASYKLLHTGNKEKIFDFGTADKTAGVDQLDTGMLYFVYE